jgi:hypothetical protein
MGMQRPLTFPSAFWRFSTIQPDSTVVDEGLMNSAPQAHLSIEN